MSGIHKTVRKAIPKEIAKADPIGTKVDTEVGKAWGSFTPDMPGQDESPIMPMADEEEIKRNKRRTASARGGGRASTIFTDSDRLGP